MIRKNKKINFKSLLSIGITMKKIIQSHKMNSREIGIHGTPMTGMDTVNLSSSCKHTTKLSCQFKALFTVTQLHLIGAYEN